MKTINYFLFALLLLVSHTTFAQWTESTSTIFQTNTGSDKDVLIGGTNTSGAGFKAMWDHSKGAFRAGRVTGTQWDNANRGFQSTAFGSNTTASGDYSVAIGSSTIASGLQSFAMGTLSNSSGNSSFAAGSGAFSSGLASFSLGTSNTSSGNYSFTLGRFLNATASNAIAMGLGLSGTSLTNNISNSLMVGFNSDEPTLFVGPSSGAGTTGEVGIGMDNPNGALGIKMRGSSFNDGLQLRTNGTTSEDWYLFMDANDDFVIDNDNFPSNRTYFKKNSGNIGVGTSGASERLTIDGAIRISNADSAYAGTIQWNGTNFQGHNGSNWVNFGAAGDWVRNGTDVFTANVGDQVGIGLNSASDNAIASLHVKGGATTYEMLLEANSPFITMRANSAVGNSGIEFLSSTSITEGFLYYDGSEDNFKISMNNTGSRNDFVIDDAGRIGMGTSAPTQKLHVVGNVAVSGQIVHPSDRNLKTNIVSINDGLSIINQLNPTTYWHKTDMAKEFDLAEGKQFGLIAQEVETVLPEMVIQNAIKSEDGTTYKGLDYEKLIPILVASVKELSSQVETLEKSNASLNVQINQLKTTNIASK